MEYVHFKGNDLSVSLAVPVMKSILIHNIYMSREVRPLFAKFKDVLFAYTASLKLHIDFNLCTWPIHV